MRNTIINYFENNPGLDSGEKWVGVEIKQDWPHFDNWVHYTILSILVYI